MPADFSRSHLLVFFLNSLQNAVHLFNAFIVCTRLLEQTYECHASHHSLQSRIVFTASATSPRSEAPFAIISSMIAPAFGFALISANLSLIEKHSGSNSSASNQFVTWTTFYKNVILVFFFHFFHCNAVCTRICNCSNLMLT